MGCYNRDKAEYRALQDKHSALNIEFADFLPVFYSSSAMFPQELIEIAGWDFDIDKVDLSTRVFDFTGIKLHPGYIEYSVVNALVKRTPEQETLLQTYRDIHLLQYYS